MAPARARCQPWGRLRFRRTVVWLVVGLLVFTLAATLLFEGGA